MDQLTILQNQINIEIMKESYNELKKLNICCDSGFPYYKEYFNNEFLRIEVLPGQYECTRNMEFVIYNRISNCGLDFEAKSKKQANIVINLRKFMNSLPEIVTSAVSVGLDIGILKICGALAIIKTVEGNRTIELSKTQALLLCILWQIKKEQSYKDDDKWNNVDDKWNIDVDGAWKKICTLNEEKNINIQKNEYQNALDRLEKLKCIEIKENKIFLKERIKGDYPQY